MQEDLPSNVKSSFQDQGDDVVFSELHAVAINGTKAQVQAVLSEYHDDIDKGDQMGRTPLMYSILGDRVTCAETLLKARADVQKVDVDERTALHWASYQGNHKMVKLLLSKGALVNAQDKEGRTSLHLATSHLNLKVMQLLLKDPTIDVDIPDAMGMTALHWCVSYSHVEHVKLLLKSKATVNCLDTEKKTVLHWANSNKDTTIVRMLVEHDQLIINCKDVEGRTALHLACGANNEDLVNFLIIEDCSLHEKDNLGRTALHWAAVLGYTRIVKLLLRRGADYRIPDLHGVRALHYAAQNNFTKTVDAMLQFSHVRDIPDNEGRTAIMWASGKGACDALKALMKHKQDVLATDSAGITALHMAAHGGHLNCVIALLENHASVNAADSHQLTPLFYAAQMGHSEVAKVLIENSAAVDLEDLEGRTPLHWAALGGRTEFCDILISNHLDPNKRDNLGRPALHCASYGGFVTCMQLLLESGANIDTQDNAGVSALHWACASGSLDAVKLLFKRNAFPNYMETDGDHLTPLDYAIIGDHQDVAQFMIEREAFTIADIQDTAATAIQSTWRGYSTRKLFKETKELLQLHERKRKESKRKAFHDDVVGSLSSMNASFGSENEGIEVDANSDCLMCGAPVSEGEQDIDPPAVGGPETSSNELSLRNSFGKDSSASSLIKKSSQQFDIVESGSKSVSDLANFRESGPDNIDILTLKQNLQREKSPLAMRRGISTLTTASAEQEPVSQVQLQLSRKTRRASLPIESLRYFQRKTISGNIDEIPENVPENDDNRKAQSQRHSSTFFLPDKNRRSSKVQLNYNSRRLSDVSLFSQRYGLDRQSSIRSAATYQGDRASASGSGALSGDVARPGPSDNNSDHDTVHSRSRSSAESILNHSGGSSFLHVDVTSSGRRSPVVVSDTRSVTGSVHSHGQSGSQAAIQPDVGGVDYSRRDSTAYGGSSSINLWPSDSTRSVARGPSPVPRESAREQGIAETSDPAIRDGIRRPLQGSSRESRGDPEGDAVFTDNVTERGTGPQARSSDITTTSLASSSRGTPLDTSSSSIRSRGGAPLDLQGRASHYQYGTASSLQGVRAGFMHRRMSSVEFSSRPYEFSYLPPNVDIAYNLRHGLGLPYGNNQVEYREGTHQRPHQVEGSESSHGASHSTSSQSEVGSHSDPMSNPRTRKVAVNVGKENRTKFTSNSASSTLSLYEEFASSKGSLSPWELHQRESMRIQLIRQKTEAAIRIQRALRKYFWRQGRRKEKPTNEKSSTRDTSSIHAGARPISENVEVQRTSDNNLEVDRSSNDTRSSSAVFEKIQLEKEQMDKEIAALTIQLVWRKYVRRRLVLANEERSREIAEEQIRKLRLLTVQEKSSSRPPRERATKKKRSPVQPPSPFSNQSQLTALTRELSLSLTQLLATRGAIPKLTQEEPRDRRARGSARQTRTHRAQVDPTAGSDTVLLNVPTRRRTERGSSSSRHDNTSSSDSHSFTHGRMWSSNLRKKTGPKR